MTGGGARTAGGGGGFMTGGVCDFAAAWWLGASGPDNLILFECATWLGSAAVGELLANLLAVTRPGGCAVLLDAASAWRCCIGAELLLLPGAVASLVTSQQRSRVTHRTHHSQRAYWYVLVPVLGTGTGKAVLVPVLSTTTGTWYYWY
jgi:hypothetical protein